MFYGIYCMQILGILDNRATVIGSCLNVLGGHKLISSMKYLVEF